MAGLTLFDSTPTPHWRPLPHYRSTAVDVTAYSRLRILSTGRARIVFRTHADRSGDRAWRPAPGDELRAGDARYFDAHDWVEVAVIPIDPTLSVIAEAFA